MTGEAEPGVTGEAEAGVTGEAEAGVTIKVPASFLGITEKNTNFADYL